MFSFSFPGRKNSGGPGGVASQFRKSNKDNKKKGSESSSEDDEKDYVKSIEGRHIIGTKNKKEKVELVIPLIGKNEWRGGGNNEELLLEQQAIREILGSGGKSSTKTKQDDDESGDVPILLKNRIPSGFETDDNLNVSLRPDQPTLDDYTKIPIQEFGMAMLRGMGWKKGEGIGLTNKKVVDVIEPQMRPRGLGLGAERPQGSQNFEPTPRGKNDEENLSLKKGACVIINQGANNGKYGKVEAFDEDNNRVIIQLAIGSKMVGISKYKIMLVSEDEFNRKSKILNNELYEEYKKKHEESDNQRQKISAAEEVANNSRTDRKKIVFKIGTSDKRTDSDQAHNYPPKPKECWVVPNLRVRFIDSKYRNGKYYRKKFIVEDVSDRDRFVLKSDEGDVLDRVKSSQIETVIPRSPSSVVYILRGREKGKIGSLIARDMESEIGVIKIPDEGVVELHFDDICEIVGDFDDLL